MSTEYYVHLKATQIAAQPCAPALQVTVKRPMANSAKVIVLADVFYFYNCIGHIKLHRIHE